MNECYHQEKYNKKLDFIKNNIKFLYYDLKKNNNVYKLLMCKFKSNCIKNDCKYAHCHSEQNLSLNSKFYNSINKLYKPFITTYLSILINHCNIYIKNNYLNGDNPYIFVSKIIDQNIIKINNLDREWITSYLCEYIRMNVYCLKYCKFQIENNSNTAKFCTGGKNCLYGNHNLNHTIRLCKDNFIIKKYNDQNNQKKYNFNIFLDYLIYDAWKLILSCKDPIFIRNISKDKLQLIIIIIKFNITKIYQYMSLRLNIDIKLIKINYVRYYCSFLMKELKNFITKKNIFLEFKKIIKSGINDSINEIKSNKIALDLINKEVNDNDRKDLIDVIGNKNTKLLSIGKRYSPKTSLFKEFNNNINFLDTDKILYSSRNNDSFYENDCVSPYSDLSMECLENCNNFKI
mgnify:CR=1 FL=1|jgi:hypothetical protein